LDQFNIKYDVKPENTVFTLIAVAYDKKFAGYLTIADSIKEDAQKAINEIESITCEKRQC